MAGFEDLIRGALLKQGNPDADARKRVYESARQALERMVTGDKPLPADVAVAQKTKLDAAIAEIEASYSAPAAAPVAPAAPPTAAPVAPPPAPDPAPVPKAPAPQPQPNPVAPAAAPTIAAPSVAASPPPVAAPVRQPTANPAPASRREPAFDELQPAADSVRLEPEKAHATEYQPAYTGSALKERKPYAKLLLWTIILVGLGVSIWWAITFGPALIKQQLDGSVPNPQQTIESGSFVPNDGDAADWVSVFAPEVNAQNVVTNGAGAAELLKDGARSVMRMSSPDNKVANNLLIKIPRGVMETLKGQAATFEIIARANQADAQEFSVLCEFSVMGNCGRKRFTAGRNVEPFIFDVLINDTLLSGDEDAFLSINTDFSGGGRPLDLYAVRVRTGS